MDISREQVLRFRVHARQLDRDLSGEVSTDAHALDPAAFRGLELAGFVTD